MDIQHARLQIMSNAGWTMSADQHFLDYKWTCKEMLDSCDAMAEKILCTIRSIPDSAWKSYTRKNVRPTGHSTCDQMTLGLVSCATNHRVPMISSCTWNLMGLTRLILVYMQKLGRFTEPIVGTIDPANQEFEEQSPCG